MFVLTHAEQVAAINKVNPNVEVLGKITKNKVKVLCCCKVCSHEWNATPESLKNGHGCPRCAGNIKLTHAEQVAAIAKVNPNVEVLGEIKGNAVKVLCRCKVCSHEWKARPNNLKRGVGCPECKKIKIGNAIRLPHTKHVADIKKANPNIEILEEIKNVREKIKCRCKICQHKWEASPPLLKQGHGCPKCGGTAKLSHQEQIKAIAKVNPGVEVLGEIKGNKTKVLCLCKVCGHKWRPTPNDLKSGKGCPECKKVKLSNAFRFTHNEHVAAIAKANPNVEVLSEIKNANTKVLCRCLVCGHEWRAKTNNLERGHGCPRCAKYGFYSHDVGKLYIMVDDLNVPTMMKIGVSVDEEERSKRVLRSAHKAGVIIPALYVAKTWEGTTELMQRIEGMMHDNYAEWNIKFPTKFDGCTEFFYYTPETAGVFDAIDETYYTVVNQF